MHFGQLLLEFTKFVLKVPDTNYDSATRRMLFLNAFRMPFPTTFKNFPTVYGSQKFITVFTTALHWYQSSARSIQYIPHQPILILPPIYVLVYLAISFWFPNQNATWIPILPIRAPRPAHLILLYLIILFILGEVYEL
jgi:Na+/alanine symporter